MCRASEANLLLVPNLADSMAGRMEIISRHPLTQDEIVGRASRFPDQLFAARFVAESIDRIY